MKKPFLPLVVSYMAGIVIGEYFYLKQTPIIFAVSGLLFFTALFFYQKKNRFLSLVSLSLFFYGIAVFNQLMASQTEFKNLLKEKQECLLRGEIISPPEYKRNRGFFKWKYKTKIKFIAKIKEIYLNDKWNQTKGKIAVTVYMTSPYLLKEGDQTEFLGYLFSPGSPSNPHQFNYKKYLKYQNISYLCSVKGKENLRKIARSTPSLRQMRTALKNFLAGNLTSGSKKEKEPSQLLCGLILGERDEISENLKSYFKKTNTMHILAISGLHLGIIAFLIISVLKVLILERRKIFIVTIFFLIFYAALVGFRPPITRTLIMILIFLIGKIIYREGNVLNSLALAALLILFINPLDIFNPGFQLSFVIVSLIVILTPKIENWFFTFTKKETSKGNQPESLWLIYPVRFLAANFAAQIASLPLIIYFYNIFSPLSLLANFVVIILMYPIIFLGFSAMLLSLFSKTILLWLNTANYYLLSLLIGFVKSLTSIPLSFFYVPSIPLIIVLLYYGGVLLLASNRYKKTVLTVFCFILISLTIFNYFKNKKFKAIFFDVGKGEATLLHFPNGKNMLIDCGSSSREDIGRWVILPYLRGEGINSIDLAVISHFHSDHCNGFFSLLEEIKINKIVAVKKELIQPLEWSLRKAFKEKKIEVLSVNNDSVLKPIAPESSLVIFSPKKEMFSFSNPQITENENSLVLKIVFKHLSFLFCGDIEKKGVTFVSSFRDRLKSSFIKVPHHGGKSSFSPEFYNFVKPKAAVIFTKRKPFAKLLSYFNNHRIRILRTDMDGATIVTLTENDYAIKTLKEKEKNAA